MAENAEKLGHLVREELSTKLNPRIALEVRGKGLLNAIVIDKSQLLCILYNYYNL